MDPYSIKCKKKHIYLNLKVFSQLSQVLKFKQGFVCTFSDLVQGHNKLLDF